MRRNIIFFLLVITADAPLFGWGPNGHRIVGLIAQHHLTPQAAEGLGHLIGYQSLAQVSTWADEIRSDPAWKKADPWHYISIDDDETLDTTHRNPKGDILWAIERFQKVLASRTASIQERTTALKFLVHLVGDIHQPLHVGRREDRGGNLVMVLWFGRPSNLHSVWDSGMIDHQKLSYTEFTGFIDHASAEQIERWQHSGVRDWLLESVKLRKQVYAVGERDLGYDYEYRNLPTVKRRLLQAGIRLAGLLNSLLPGS